VSGRSVGNIAGKSRSSPRIFLLESRQITPHSSQHVRKPSFRPFSTTLIFFITVFGRLDVCPSVSIARCRPGVLQSARTKTNPSLDRMADGATGFVTASDPCYTALILILWFDGSLASGVVGVDRFGSWPSTGERVSTPRPPFGEGRNSSTLEFRVRGTLRESRSQPSRGKSPSSPTLLPARGAEKRVSLCIDHEPASCASIHPETGACS